MRWTRALVAVVTFVLIVTVVSFAQANGIYREGVGARAMALGGSDVAWAEDPLGALALNPAALGLLSSSTLNLGLTTVIPTGSFTNRANANGDLQSDPGFLPEAAFSMRLGRTPLTIGAGIFPEAGLRGEWQYVDTPGGVGGISYGPQKHESEISVLRGVVGLGLALGDKFAIGASVALIYNQNRLEAPYIFQSQPQLRGLKTLLDLETDGFGAGGSVGVLFRPRPDLQFGVTYKTPTTVYSYGRAAGNAGVQLDAAGLAVQPSFRYDAEVRNKFPQMVMAGVSWKPLPRWRFTAQVDWIDWSEAFDDLRITLTKGNNATINGIVGSDSLRDVVPLKWEDRFVVRVGAEYEVLQHLWLRAGYAWGESPVPDRTLLPLTAVITEHTLAAGLGYRRGPVQVDFAYQVGLPKERNVGPTLLQAGEYSNSATEVGLHWIGLTGALRF